MRKCPSKSLGPSRTLTVVPSKRRLSLAIFEVVMISYPPGGRLSRDTKYNLPTPNSVCALLKPKLFRSLVSSSGGITLTPVHRLYSSITGSCGYRQRNNSYNPFEAIDTGQMP